MLPRLDALGRRTPPPHPPLRATANVIVCKVKKWEFNDLAT